MATLSDLMPYVLPYVVGCTYPLAEQHIRNVCIDFCTHAPIVQERLDPIDVEKGRIEYDIDTSPQTDVTLILDATFQGRPLAIAKTGDANFFAQQQIERDPGAVIQSAGNLFSIDYLPARDVPGAISLMVATKPKRNAQVIADVLIEDYADTLTQGIVGRLLMIPGHEFSNPSIAALYTGPYEVARTSARIRAERSFGASSARVRPREFGF